MSVYTEVLPATKSCPHAAIRWSPSPGGPGLGLLWIDQTRASCCYTVATFPVEWDGVGLAFHKPAGEPGTDTEVETYEVFIDSHERDHRCDCKGFERWGKCKHVSAALALLANGWL